MQVSGIINLQNTQYQPHFKENLAQSAPFANFPVYQQIPLNASKAYASPQITEGFKKIETFNLSGIGDAKIYELSNGHKIILVPRKGKTVIHTCIGAGEDNESTNKKGVSNLLGYLLDSYCTNPKTKEVKSILNKTEAECNVNIYQDFIGYCIKASVENPKDFEDLIKIQTQTLSLKDFSVKDIENKKEIALQELNLKHRYIDVSNYYLAVKLSVQNLFNLHNNESTLTPKRVNSLDNINKEDLISYYNEFYQPSNMITAIVGNVDDNSIKVIAKHFNSVRQSTNNKGIVSPKTSVDNSIKKTVKQDVQSIDPHDSSVCIDLAFIGPKNDRKKENVLVQMLNWLIEERMNNSMKNDDNKDINNSSVNNSSVSDYSTIHLIHQSSNIDTENSIKTMYSIISDLKQNPISEEELQAVKEKHKEIINFDWDRFADDSSFALSAAMIEEMSSSGILDFKKKSKLIGSITLKDIQETAKRYLDLDRASLVVIHPQEEKY